MSPEYEFRSFPAGLADSPDAPKADEPTAAWLQATALGFLEDERTEPLLGRIAEVYVEDSRRLSGAYTPRTLPGVWPAELPVATYATFDKKLNVGGGRQITARLVAGVTVRANHRRRGLMRQLVEGDLKAAAADGIPICALHAAEATIYGRFGFGPATSHRRVHVDTGPGFALDHEPTGTVDVAGRAALFVHAPEVFARFHAQTLGSIERSASYPSKIAGIWAEDRPEPLLSTRGLFHYDPSGELDGYVSYRFDGWGPKPPTISIIDFVTLNREAYLELWQHLAAIDTVARVHLDDAPLTDPLPWAMRDSRGYAITGGEDGIWLRILDVAATLTARSYVFNGEISVLVKDALGIATGQYLLTVRDGAAEVTRRNSGTADITLDVSALGSLYLGGVSARTLARAGTVTATSTEALKTFDRLLRQDDEPVCITGF